MADYNSVQAMVENGLGISIVPKLASIAGRFNVKKIHLNPSISREIGLIYKNKNQLSTPSQIFINYLVDYTKNLLFRYIIFLWTKSIFWIKIE